ncbi:hypothetical protein GCM10020367_72030 [Streptomyces sannanensis]|uniref:Uncharacterized protein n=1 Tax=Streptomyces sannanensis TaxID=285536 RepID=A0ABP6SPH6_9ACTN
MTTPVEELFVQPAPGDAGCAIGAALDVALRRGDLALPGAAMTTAALGPAFDAGAIRSVLDDYGPAFHNLGNDLSSAVAGHLALGRTVGWFQGRTGAGPRARGGSGSRAADTSRSAAQAPRLPGGQAM